MTHDDHSSSQHHHRQRHIQRREGLVLINEKLDNVFKRILANKNVEGIIVLDGEGTPVKTTMESSLTIKYATLMTQLSLHSESLVRDLDPSNELKFLRIKSKKHEIMIAPDGDFTALVIQNSHIEHSES